MTEKQYDDLVLYLLRAAHPDGLSSSRIMSMVQALGFGHLYPIDSLRRLRDAGEISNPHFITINITPGCRKPPRPDLGNPMQFVYANHIGETALRTVAPIRIYHGATEYHPEPQWLLEAIDLDKDALRTFAMRNIKEIK